MLVCEDDKKLADIIIDTLKNEGYNTSLAKNGEEGIEMFFQKKFDLIITDVMMPVMDGNVFAKEIRKEPKNVPILFLTVNCKYLLFLSLFDIALLQIRYSLVTR